MNVILLLLVFLAGVTTSCSIGPTKEDPDLRVYTEDFAEIIGRDIDSINMYFLSMYQVSEVGRCYRAQQVIQIDPKYFYSSTSISRKSLLLLADLLATRMMR